MADAEDEARALFFEALDELDRGENHRAEERLRAALELVPDRTSALTNLAVALFRQGRFGEAADVGERAVALDAENVDGWVVLGGSLAKGKRDERA